MNTDQNRRNLGGCRSQMNSCKFFMIVYSGKEEVHDWVLHSLQLLVMLRFQDNSRDDIDQHHLSSLFERRGLDGGMKNKEACNSRICSERIHGQTYSFSECFFTLHKMALNSDPSLRYNLIMHAHSSSHLIIKVQVRTLSSTPHYGVIHIALLHCYASSVWYSIV